MDYILKKYLEAFNETTTENQITLPRILTY